MKDELSNIRNEAVAQIMEAGNAEEIEETRVHYLGRSGVLAKLTKRLPELPESERKEVGAFLNEVKSIISDSIKEKLKSHSQTKSVWFDPTIPGIKPETGNLHLVTKTIREITKIFSGLGFVRVRYPEVEWNWFAFTALNFPENHPAMDELETFIVEAPEDKKMGKMVLSPHTSSGQVREMQRVNATPPIRMMNIAKCYRRESDASHYPQFHQFEGMVIDRGVNITHLIGTLNYFVKHFYGEGIKTRLRPHNFKFTEPSFEVDITCMVCGGKSCKVCKEGWLEQAGAGMIHPKVLSAGGIDPNKYTGFAFGWGVERAYMMKPGLEIPDLRVIYSSDMGILKQL